MGIKIQDVAYVRFSAPDLDQMETFLTEFGMVRADRTGDALYMRGLDGDAFLHVTHRGEPRFVAAGFEAASMQDLEALAREEKASLDHLDGPGGGYCNVPKASERIVADDATCALPSTPMQRHGSTRSSASPKRPRM